MKKIQLDALNLSKLGQHKETIKKIPLIFLAGFILVFALKILMAYTSWGSYFCLDCENKPVNILDGTSLEDNKKLAYKYTQATIPISINESITVGKKDMHLKHDAESSVLKLTNNGSNILLQNVSHDSTVYIISEGEKIYLPQLKLANLTSFSKDLSSCETNPNSLQLKVNSVGFCMEADANLNAKVHSTIDNKPVSYEIKQGIVTSYTDRNGVTQKVDHCSKRLLKHYAHRAKKFISAKREVTFGGDLYCNERIPVPGLAPKSLLLELNQKQGYIVRLPSGNTSVMYKNLILFKLNNKWTHFQNITYPITTGKNYSMKVGYTNFQDVSATNNVLTLKLGKNTSTQKHSKQGNNLDPSALFNTANVTNQSSNTSLASTSINNNSIPKANSITPIDKDLTPLVSSGLLGLLVGLFILASTVAHSINKPEGITKFAPLCAVVVGWGLLRYSNVSVWATLLLLLIISILWLAFKEANTLWFVAVASFIVIILVSLDYGLALSTTHPDTKYFYDFATQLQKITTMCSFWLLLMIYQTDLKYSAVYKPSKEQSFIGAVVVLFILFGLGICYIFLGLYSEIDIPLYELAFLCFILLVATILFLFSFVAKTEYVNLSIKIACIGALIIIMSLAFGSETGLFGILQPNELSKLLLCIAIAMLFANNSFNGSSTIPLIVLLIVAALASIVVNEFSFIPIIMCCLTVSTIAYFLNIYVYHNPVSWQKIVFIVISLCFVFSVIYGFSKMGEINTLLIISSVSLLLSVAIVAYVKRINTNIAKTVNSLYAIYLKTGTYTFIGATLVLSCWFIIYGIFMTDWFMNFHLLESMKIRVEILRNAISFPETGYQILKAHELSSSPQHIYDFIKVPEVDDDFAYTGWLHSETMLPKVTIFIAWLGFMVSSLAIMLKIDTSITREKRFSSLYFVIAAFTIFSMHFLIAVSTNLNLLPVMGQPFSMLGRQGSHIILFVFMVLFVITYTKTKFINRNN